LIEVFLRRFTTLGYPRVKYVNVNDQPRYVFVSRTATVRELHAQLCRAYAAESNGRWTTEELMGLSRLWKFEGDDSIDDARHMLTEINGDLKKLPLQI